MDTCKSDFPISVVQLGGDSGICGVQGVVFIRRHISTGLETHSLTGASQQASSDNFIPFYIISVAPRTRFSSFCFSFFGTRLRSGSPAPSLAPAWVQKNITSAWREGWISEMFHMFFFCASIGLPPKPTLCNGFFAGYSLFQAAASLFTCL